MKNILIWLTALTSLVLSNPIQEREVFLNINSDNLQIGYESESLSSLITSGSAFKYDISYLNGEELHFITGSLKSVNTIEKMKGSELGIGIEAIYLNILDDEFSFLPLSISFKYNLPALMFNIPPVSIDTKLSYAPKVLSFDSDIKSFLSSSIEINLEPIRDVKIYTGYRNVSSKRMSNQDILIDEIYGGLKMSF